MLLIDSITRVARAQREVGLAAGEPPTRRGFPPSAFALLPRLLERAGQSDKGSITAIYTVLVEGNDIDEPVADEVRGVLDGHIVLSREIAGRGRFPAIDITTSLSRVMDAIVSKDHAAAARKLRALVSTYESKRDLLTLGAYEKGSDAELDHAIARMPKIESFLRQEPTERAPIAATIETLSRLVSR
jgi:ATP synthase in type III secretion protein N